MKRHLLTLIVALVTSVTFATDWTALTLGTSTNVPTGESYYSVAADKDGVMTLVCNGVSLAVYDSAAVQNEISTSSSEGKYQFSATNGSTYYIQVWNNDSAPTTITATLTELSDNDYTTLSMEQTFAVNDNGNAIWTITPTESGTIKIVGVGNEQDDPDSQWIGSCLNVFDNAGMTTQIQNYNYRYYEFAAESGHTYYIKNTNTSGMDYTAKCIMGEAFAFASSDPADGTVFYIIGDCQANLKFTSATVTFTEGELTSGSNTIKIYNFDDWDSLVDRGIITVTEVGTSGVADYNGNVLATSDRNEGGILIPFLSWTPTGSYNVIYEWIKGGKVNPNDVMTLTMHGVKNSVTNEMLNGDGELTLTWYAPNLPTSLVSSKTPETFLSYWLADDEDGIVELKFSNGIKSAKARIEMGSADANELYSEEVPTTIENDKVLVDLTGVIRTMSTMGLRNTWATMQLSVYDVVDIDNQGTYSEDQGKASSYDFNMPYRDISGEVSFDFTPANGTELTASVQTIELWVKDIKEIIEYDAIEATYYTIETTQEEIDGETVDVTVTVPHTTTYLISEYATNGMTVNVGVEGTTLTIPVTDEMRNAQNLNVRLRVTKSHDGREHNIVAYYNTTISHDYAVKIYADPSDQATVHRLKEIYLTLGSTYAINENAAAHLVTVHGKTTNYTGTGTIVKDGKTNAKIVLDDAITEADAYDITVVAGAIGDYIYGESGYKSGTTNEEFTLNYTVDGEYAGTSVTTDPANNSTVTSLKEFSITFWDYNSVAPSWDADNAAYVYDANNPETIFTGQFQELGEHSAQTLTFVLDNEITAPGAYVLQITAGSVLNAATGNAITQEYKFDYNVDPGHAADDKPLISPAEGEVETLTSITLTFQDKSVSAIDEWAIASVEKENGDVESSGEIAKGANDNQLVINLWDAVKKGGTYTLIIPANTITFTDGTQNAKYTYTFTIQGGTTGGDDTPQEVGSVTITPQEGAGYQSLQKFALTFNDWGSFMNTDFDYPVLKNADGDVVVTAWNGLEMSEDGFNSYIIDFEEAVTEPGTYTLVVPVELFSTDWMTNIKTSCEFKFTIGDQDAVEGIIAATGTADVYTINGMLVKKAATVTDVKSLPAGLYIINAQRVLLRK